MSYDAYDVCSDCSEAQSVEVIFEAIHPITRRIFVVNYCKHIDLILTTDVKHAIGKVSCPFPQRVRDDKMREL